MSESADHERPPPPLLPCGVALSIALGAFALIGWLLSGGILTDTGIGQITAQSAVPALYAALAIIMQVTAAIAAIAARWARGFKLEGSERWAIRVVAAGGIWNAYSLHNAFEHALPDDAGGFPQFVAWVVSVAVAFVEIAVYWVDESLKSEVTRRRRADEAATLAGARGLNLTRMDERALTDEALKSGIREATGVKRRLEVERDRRRKRNIVTN